MAQSYPVKYSIDFVFPCTHKPNQSLQIVHIRSCPISSKEFCIGIRQFGI